MKIFTASLLFILCCGQSQAEDAISRRDGYLLIWDSILRPAEKTREPPFVDVVENERGFLEITYGKRRGLIDDSESFYPNANLSLDDALLWLYRTRNVRAWDNMQQGDLPSLLEQYPIQRQKNLSRGNTVSREELQHLIEKLDQLLQEEVHEVSFYADAFHGKGTAFGETFNMHELTAAHRTLPHNTLLKVKNVENEKWVIVRINDRGPFIEGRDLDLSLAAFEALSVRSRGTLNATFERLGDSNILASKDQQDSQKASISNEDSSEDGHSQEVSVVPDVVDASGHEETFSFIDQLPPAATKPVQACPSTLRYQRRITRNVRFYTGIPHVFSFNKPLELESDKVFIIHEIQYPSGSVDNQATWIDPGQSYQFVPRQIGDYVFVVGTANGRKREMKLASVECSG